MSSGTYACLDRISLVSRFSSISASLQSTTCSALACPCDVFVCTSRRVSSPGRGTYPGSCWHFSERNVRRVESRPTIQNMSTKIYYVYMRDILILFLFAPKRHQKKNSLFWLHTVELHKKSFENA